MAKSKMQATIYSLFLLTFNEHNHLDPNHSFAQLFDFWEKQFSNSIFFKKQQDVKLLMKFVQ